MLPESRIMVESGAGILYNWQFYGMAIQMYFTDGDSTPVQGFLDANP